MGKEPSHHLVVRSPRNRISSNLAEKKKMVSSTPGYKRVQIFLLAMRQKGEGGGEKKKIAAFHILPPLPVRKAKETFISRLRMARPRKKKGKKIAGLRPYLAHTPEKEKKKRRIGELSLYSFYTPTEAGGEDKKASTKRKEKEKSSCLRTSSSILSFRARKESRRRKPGEVSKPPRPRRKKRKRKKGGSDESPF